MGSPKGILTYIQPTPALGRAQTPRGSGAVGRCGGGPQVRRRTIYAGIGGVGQVAPRALRTGIDIVPGQLSLPAGDQANRPSIRNMVPIA